MTPLLFFLPFPMMCFFIRLLFISFSSRHEKLASALWSSSSWCDSAREIFQKLQLPCKWSIFVTKGWNNSSRNSYYRLLSQEFLSLCKNILWLVEFPTLEACYLSLIFLWCHLWKSIPQFLTSDYPFATSGKFSCI